MQCVPDLLQPGRTFGVRRPCRVHSDHDKLTVVDSGS